jgi:membrane protease YdiL (CAAX protease family)
MAATNQDPPNPQQFGLVERIFISPNQARLRTGWRLLLQFLLLIVLTVAFGSLALVARIDLTALQDEDVLLVYLLSMAGVVTSVYLARRFFDRRSFVSLGLRLDREALRDLVVGTTVAGVVFSVITLILWGIGWLVVDGFAWQNRSWASILPDIWRTFILYSMVSLSEEIWNRGYLLQNLEDGLNTIFAVALSSLVFGLSHLGNPNVSPQAVIGISFGGVFLAFAYLRTRSLWLPIGLHLGWNFFEGAVFGYPVSGMNLSPNLLVQEARGPAWITGGTFGPEAGLVLLPGLLVGAWILAQYTQERRQEVA